MAKSSKYRGVTLFRPTGKWRAQISAGGKTTSLGDHDTEEEAARAFDRAAINKGGFQARTNFSVMEYAAELDQLQSMGQAELVQMLRSRARKSGTQTSNYRGVSLLKQTKKWHAQINVSGKQVHLGFFPTEEQAARAYDRAAINKGARESTKIITNFHIREYEHELDILCSITQQEIVDALASESRRKGIMEMLAKGTLDKAEEVFGRKLVCTLDRAAIELLKSTAERAVPKLQHLQRWALPPGSAGSALPSTSAAAAQANAQPPAGKAAARNDSHTTTVVRRDPQRKKARRRNTSDDDDLSDEPPASRRSHSTPAGTPRAAARQLDDDFLVRSRSAVRTGPRSARKRAGPNTISQLNSLINFDSITRPFDTPPGFMNGWTLPPDLSPSFGLSAGLVSPGFPSPGLQSPGLIDFPGLSDADSLGQGYPPLAHELQFSHNSTHTSFRQAGAAPSTPQPSITTKVAPGARALRLGSGKNLMQRQDASNRAAGKGPGSQHRLFVDVSAAVRTAEADRNNGFDHDHIISSADAAGVIDSEMNMALIGDSPLGNLSALRTGPLPSSSTPCTPRGSQRSPLKTSRSRGACSGDESPSKGSAYSPGQPTGSSRRTFKRPERAVM